VLAIVGGTGFGEFAGLEHIETVRRKTPFGNVDLQAGVLEGKKVLFLPRHGMPASLPPHKVNYRGNIQALKDAGATGIIGVNAVGSVDPSLAVPSVVVPHQLIDYTWGRDHTFYEDRIHHVDFTSPYDEDLRGRVVAAARAVHAADGEMPFRADGVYGCTQGPRLETAAEIRRMGQDGCHVVGMTAMPEVALARERGIPYAGISIVVNAGAGIDGGTIDFDALEAMLAKGTGWAREIIVRVVALPEPIPAART
jgi:5'-methylthioinosine phosphorylase